MKFKEIHVSTKFTKNLGNYQSFTAEAGATVEIDPGGAVDEAFQSAWQMVKDQVSEQVKSLKTGGQ